ncbi:MAG: sugar phosphate isomerase/epimerase [Candidatus Sumerlaeota bacterium]|nr:sugar phosphate isomerase/epimerase [Candidatus Sumerlaeota bacterium]
MGMMAWRIGEIRDVREQIEWIRDAGFEGVGFHASPGVPGEWEGIDPYATGRGARAQWKKALSHFPLIEVHAPVNCVLREEGLGAAADEVIYILAFAGDLGATVVTAHAKPPDPERKRSAWLWGDTLERLNGVAAVNGVTLGLEVVEGFDSIARLGLSNVGVTLDVGHMYHDDARPLRPFGTLGEVVHRCGRALAHLHLHDHNGAADHVELGTGRVDFGDLWSALRGVGYEKGLMLELNPDRCPPEGILRSRAWARERERIGG